MQVEYLSDHVDQQLRASEHRMREAQSDLEARRSELQHTSGQERAARRAKPWWKRLLFITTPEERAARLRRQHTQQRIFQGHQEIQRIDQRIQQQNAGAEGELLLERGLAHLSDEWVLLRGYRNKRGEADLVLVGPRGVWAVEVKYRRVRLHVNGTRWWYEKLDSWGNVVEHGQAVDRTGRTWGDQVENVAQELRGWLGRNSQHTPVRTAVMLMHHQAELGQCENLSVNLLGTAPAHLVEAIWEHQASLTPAQCAGIVDLIKRDHRFHNRNRPQRGRERNRARYRNS